MLVNSLKCCTKHIGSTGADLNNFYSLTGGKQWKWYSKETRCSCCKDAPQTAGRTVEPWPKSDTPPPAWRCECPREPMPYNNDPYRIKVPEIAVPPLPPSNAKRMGVVLTYTDPRDPLGMKDWSQHQQPGHSMEHQPQQQPEAEEEDGSFFGKLKKFFRGKKDREEMTASIDCARKGTCAPLAPPPPPCPPPPRKPFPWSYVFVPTAILVALGVIYKYWAYKEKLRQSGMFDVIWQPRIRVKRPYHEHDLPECVQYLIIGSGTAGWAAYRSIMENDPKAKVFFITKEDIMPYTRIPMSKFMWWNKLPPDIKTLKYFDQKYKTMYLSKCKNFLDPVNFYRKAEGPAVSIASGWCVLRLDADNHIAYIKTMCGERPMYYERCLLAVGSKPTQLNIFKIAPKEVREKVTTFRTIRDLESAYRKVRAARHVTIIGGGTLGCELAWHIAKMKDKLERDEADKEKPPLEVAMMYKDGGVLGSVLPEYLGEWAAEKIKCDGVHIMPKTTPHDAFLSKDGRLELTLNDGSSLVTDYAFVCVGATPRVELAEPSYLEQDAVNGGFLANTELEVRTHLYAAGDAASFYSQWKNTRQRFQNQTPAEEEGALAGLNMTGYWDPCNIEQCYWLSLGETIEMQVVGDVGACMPIIALFKPCRPEDLPAKERDAKMALACYKDAAEYKERYKRGLLCYLRDETIVGFVFWNMPPIADRKEVATEILRSRPHYNDINIVADQLGFSETHCVYLRAEEIQEPGPCIQAYREF